LAKAGARCLLHSVSIGESAASTDRLDLYCVTRVVFPNVRRWLAMHCSPGTHVGAWSTLDRAGRFAVVAARSTATYLEDYLRWCRPGLCRREGGPNRALWLTMLGKPMRYFTVRARLHRYAETLGIDKRLPPYGLRHACATHLMERRAELRHIQELLGHASVATTQIYTHVSIGHLKETLQRCHPRERGTIAE